MQRRMRDPAEVAQSFREDCLATGSDVQVLRQEREKAIAVISAFCVAAVFSIHLLIRARGFEWKDANPYLLTIGLGLVSLLARSRMKRATEALDHLEQPHHENQY